MEKQTEENYAGLKKRQGWLAVANGLLFVAICVTVALLASILKNHASSDDDAIALVPENSVVNESIVPEAEGSTGSEAAQETGAASSEGETSGEDINTEENTQETSAEASKEQVVINKDSLGTAGNGNGSTVGNGVSMQVGVTYEDQEVTVPLHPSIKVYDDQRVWETDTKVDIFKIQYENDEAKVTVNGGDDKLLAPGTSNEYTFYLKNTGDVKLDYTLTLEAYFTPADQPLPVEVKLKGYDGTYLVGSEDSWSDVLVLNDVKDKASINVNRFAYYTLEWQWPFERGEDEFDTYLGNRAVDEDLTLTIVIKTVATGDDSTTEINRVPIPSWVPSIPKTGDDSNILLWAGLLGASVVMLIIILVIKKRREKEETDEEN